MEDVLAVYTRPHDPDRPLVCLDESSKQLIAEERVPIPMKPGRPARVDYEYERNGTANLFMMFAPLEGWRHIEVTDRHTAIDYAHVLKDLADRHFAQAKTIVLVQDNLNIHIRRRQLDRDALLPRGKLAQLAEHRLDQLGDVVAADGVVRQVGGDDLGGQGKDFPRPMFCSSVIKFLPDLANPERQGHLLGRHSW